MATIQEAVQNAVVFARDSLGVDRTSGLRLEEIESATEGSIEVWRVTLSMIESDTVSALLSSRREYKTFAVEKATGEVTSMKIRELSKV